MVRICNLNQVLNLPPFHITEFEIGVMLVVIQLEFYELSQLVGPAKHVAYRIPLHFNILNEEQSIR